MNLGSFVVIFIFNAAIWMTKKLTNRITFSIWKKNCQKKSPFLMCPINTAGNVSDAWWIVNLSESLKPTAQRKRRKTNTTKSPAFVQFIRLHEIELTALIGLLAFNCTILTIICLWNMLINSPFNRNNVVFGLQLQCHWHSPECTRQREWALFFPATAIWIEWVFFLFRNESRSAIIQ